MARNEDLQDKLCAAGWDLVIFDEAHKLAAHFFGNKLEKTGRFRLAEKVGAQTCHYRKSNPGILIVQSAQDRAADNASGCLGGA